MKSNSVWPILRKWWLPITWYTCFVFLYLIVLTTSDKIEMSLAVTADGLIVFAEVFKIPLYFFAAGIPVIGIYLTILRMQQTEKILMSNIQQLKMLEKQNEESEKRRLESIFISLVDTHNKFVENFKIPKYTSYSGRHLFHVLKGDLVNQTNKKALEEAPDKLQFFKMNFMKFLNTYDPLNTYLQNLKSVLDHVYDNALLKNEPNIYINRLKSSLSRYELIFIFYYSLLDDEFKSKVMEFDLLEKIRVEDLVRPDDIELLNK